MDELSHNIDSLKNTSETLEYKRLLELAKDRLLKPFPIEEQLSYFSSVYNNHKDRDVEFIYIAEPDNDYVGKRSAMRMWKAAIKKHQIIGHHFIMNPELSEKVRKRIFGITNNRFLPQYYLVTKQGIIVDPGILHNF